MYFMIRINRFSVNKFALLPFFLVVVPLVVYVFLIQFRFWSTITIPASTFGTITTNAVTQSESQVDSVSTGPILFVGDVLLARNVEYLMQTKGAAYPFKNLPDLFGTKSSAIIGNFESAILERHIRTPSYITTFSVDKKYISLLHEVGFTHMSLANNHSNDYGSTTLAHTKQILQQAGIYTFGHPLLIDNTAMTVVRSGATTVGIIGINQVLTPIKEEELILQLSLLSSTTDFQIVYIHFGDEYMLKHNSNQELIARMVIDAGADAVIGHHPHVVQDIDVYKQRPIFYSLGNFIFDQYFSVDVKQGLMLSVTFLNNEVHYELVPVTSENSNSQPYRMGTAERELFLINLARRSNLEYSENIKQGKLILPFSLATYSQTGMITP